MKNRLLSLLFLCCLLAGLVFSPISEAKGKGEKIILYTTGMNMQGIYVVLLTQRTLGKLQSLEYKINNKRVGIEFKRDKKTEKEVKLIYKNDGLLKKYKDIYAWKFYIPGDIRDSNRKKYKLFFMFSKLDEEESWYLNSLLWD